MKHSIVTIVLFLMSFNSFGSLDSAWKNLKRSNGTIKYYPSVIEDFVNEGLYFASIPYIKEYLVRGSGRDFSKIDRLIDKVVSEVGIKQFEVLPTKFIKKSNAPMMRYLLAKKYFRKGQYTNALRSIEGEINSNHPVLPFALMLKASSLSILKKYTTARSEFKECISESNRRIKRAGDSNLRRQLEINRDYCIVGVARTQFAGKQHKKALSSYLDLSKGSHIWPEILFEEAWNSFYLRDFNRVLGKLVTYKAPIMDYIFNPEIDVLRALSYMELCLWGDVKQSANEFYKRYENNANHVNTMVKRIGKKYHIYYKMAKSATKGEFSENRLVQNIMKSIVRDATFIELFDSFNSGKDEIEKLKKIRNKRLRRILNINLKEALLLQRNLIGAYVRKSFKTKMHQLNKSFEHMSYIKLEVLSRRKQFLYTNKKVRTRGSISNLKRNDKQYFWTFNGEFWADELGDYVFSLKSECE